MVRLARWAPWAIVAVVATWVIVSSLGGDGPRDEPVDLRAHSPRVADLTELVDAADLVVEGSVVAVEEGRTITDPADPTIGVRTRLAQVAVDRTTSTGTNVPAIVVVEQEASLLGGEPITVDGVAPFEVGQVIVVVLVRGTSEEFPYTTPIDEQGVFTVVDDVVVAADPEGAVGSRFHGRPADELRAALGLRAPPP